MREFLNSPEFIFFPIYLKLADGAAHAGGAARENSSEITPSQVIEAL